MTYNIKNKESIVTYNLKGLMPDEALSQKDYDIFKNVEKFDNTWDIKILKNIPDIQKSISATQKSQKIYYLALYYSDDCYLIHEEPLTYQEISEILNDFKPSLFVNTDEFLGWSSTHYPFRQAISDISDYLVQSIPQPLHEAVSLVESENKVNIIQFLNDFYKNL